MSTGEREVDDPAQRRREPHPVVVDASRVEADDEARRADAVGERLDVGRQVGRSRSPRWPRSARRSGRGRRRRRAPPRSRRGWRTPRSRRRRRLCRRGGRLRSPESTGRARRASRASPVACRDARRAATVSSAGASPKAGTSTTITGVRPSSSCTSTVAPSIGPRRAPVADQLDGALHVAVLGPFRVEGDADVRESRRTARARGRSHPRRDRRVPLRVTKEACANAMRRRANENFTASS